MAIKMDRVQQIKHKATSKPIVYNIQHLDRNQSELHYVSSTGTCLLTLETPIMQIWRKGRCIVKLHTRF